MARRPSAGDLRDRVAFEARVEENPDSPLDYGNTESVWAEQFEQRAAYMHLRGGDAVQAARLEGRHIQVIRVRSDSATRIITTDWRAIDQNTGDVFNVRDASPTREAPLHFIDLLCEKGVAT